MVAGQIRRHTVILGSQQQVMTVRAVDHPSAKTHEEVPAIVAVEALDCFGDTDSKAADCYLGSSRRSVLDSRHRCDHVCEYDALGFNVRIVVCEKRS